jgi:hypothetical protein
MKKCKDTYRICNSYLSKMQKDCSQVCYTAGCNNYATVALKIPLGSKIQCIIHVCKGCLSKYELDDSDKLQHPHQRLK